MLTQASRPPPSPLYFNPTPRPGGHDKRKTTNNLAGCETYASHSLHKVPANLDASGKRINRMMGVAHHDMAGMVIPSDLCPSPSRTGKQRTKSRHNTNGNAMRSTHGDMPRNRGTETGKERGLYVCDSVGATFRLACCDCSCGVMGYRLLPPTLYTDCTGQVFSASMSLVTTRLGRRKGTMIRGAAREQGSLVTSVAQPDRLRGFVQHEYRGLRETQSTVNNSASQKVPQIGKDRDEQLDHHHARDSKETGKHAVPFGLQPDSGTMVVMR
ncbi:hypothetical protein BaRGS_00002756 [Batillaria attramentaria]|uniref:Uncharacterized protein n=1 Tax=Batillaria attramentaria TaxID=370345 RepID=A0ABD0M3U3_9CAEN